MASTWVMNSLWRASFARMAKSCQKNAKVVSSMAPPFTYPNSANRERRG